MNTPELLLKAEILREVGQCLYTEACWIGSSSSGYGAIEQHFKYTLECIVDRLNYAAEELEHQHKEASNV